MMFAKALINPKWEILKGILFLFLLSLYHPIYNLLYNLLDGNFDGSNILYVDRILFIVLICAVLVYLRAKFLKFVRKDWDSLILLGCSYPQRFLLFFLTNYGALILLIYFGTMIFKIQKLTVGLSIPVNILNAVLIYLFSVLSCVIFHTKMLHYSVCILAGALGIMVGAKKISFHNVYLIIMSDNVSRLLFSADILSLLIKIIFCICLFLVLIYKCKSSGIDVSIAENHFRRTNMAGDLMHWLSRKHIYFKNYFWMYRSTDFILWKIFSTIIFVFICYAEPDCYAEPGRSVIFLTAYGICLISSLYFIDTYHLECRLFLHYFMSDYPYKKILADFTKGGFFLLGDNILIILLIRCFIQPRNIIILPLIIIAIFFISIFVNSHLFAKYPLKQYYLNICLILIKLHIPVFHFYFLYKCIRDGKRNWENMNYENDRSSDDRQYN